MAATAIIPIHAGKGRSVAAALKMSVRYIENPEKTDSGEWVTSYECDPLIADKEFLFSKNQYAAITGRDQGKNDVLAYHLRISFKPGETDAEMANKIGYELAMKLTRGQHAFVCCTHTDKQHVHTHCIINSTNLDYTKKFRNIKGSAFVIRKIADQLCAEHGLSVIENPKPSKGKNYGKHMGEGKPPSNREQLEQIIDSVLHSSSACKDFDGFISAMVKLGCEVKRGKHLSVKIPGATRFARLKSLGEDYTEDAIRERILGKRLVQPKQKIIAVAIPTLTLTPTPNIRVPKLLIDIEARLQKANSPGFEHYARIYNLKEMARTLIFLRDSGIGTYDELNEKIKSLDMEHGNRSNRIKEIEARQKEISELQRNIGTYNKTKDTYNEYRRLKKVKLTKWQELRKVTHPADDYYESHRANITLCESTKKYFNKQGYGKEKKIPKMQSLKEEYAILEKEKRKLYNGFSKQRDEAIALKLARRNCDMFLGEPNQPAKERSHEHAL